MCACVCVNTGTLIQVMMDKSRSGFGRLGSFSSSFKDGRKETVRMAFLFTNHLLLTTRASNGRLHLAKVSESISGITQCHVLLGAEFPRTMRKMYNSLMTVYTDININIDNAAV